jgi:hypothetical protein
VYFKSFLDYFGTYTTENQTILPGYIYKVVCCLIAKESERVKELVNKDTITLILNHVDNDSVADMVYMLTTLDNELLNVVFAEIDDKLQTLVDGGVDTCNELITEKIKNLVMVAIRFYRKLMYKGFSDASNYRECIELYLSRFNKLSKYVRIFLEKEVLQNWHIKSIKNLYLLYSQFLVPLFSDVENETNMITRQYIDGDLNALTNSQSTNENLNDEFKAAESNSKTQDNRLILTDEDLGETFLLYYVNYMDLYKLADKIRNESTTVDSLHKTNPVKHTTEPYLLFLDITIMIALMKKESFISLINENIAIIIKFLNTVLVHPNNSFLQVKVLKIIEILLFDPFYTPVSETLLPFITEYFNQILPSMHFKDLVSVEKKCLSYISLSTLNTAFLFKLIQLFYNLQKNQHEIKNNPFIGVEDYILIYLDVTSKDLLSKEIQSKEDLKNAGDEEMKFAEKNCKI